MKVIFDPYAEMRPTPRATRPGQKTPKYAVEVEHLRVWLDNEGKDYVELTCVNGVLELHSAFKVLQIEPRCSNGVRIRTQPF